MSVIARLRPELIRIAPPWHSFSETITGLVDLLVGARAIPPECTSEAVRAVAAREAEG